MTSEVPSSRKSVSPRKITAPVEEEEIDTCIGQPIHQCKFLFVNIWSQLVFLVYEEDYDWLKEPQPDLQDVDDGIYDIDDASINWDDNSDNWKDLVFVLPWSLILMGWSISFILFFHLRCTLWIYLFRINFWFALFWETFY